MNIITVSWKKLSDEEGFDFFDQEFNHKFRGVARMECVEIITKASGKKYTSEQKKELADRKNRYFTESLSNVTAEVFLPGALSMLHELKKRGIKMAVASNSRNAVTIIRQVKIEHLLMPLLTDIRSKIPNQTLRFFCLLQKKLAFLLLIVLLLKMLLPE